MHCYCVIILQSDNPSAPTLRYGALQEGDDVTVMPQEDFMLQGLHSDYRVHVNGQYGPLGSVDSATLRATSRLWRKLRARYLKVGGDNTSALRILADIEREHAASLCCSSSAAAVHWDLSQREQEQCYKDAASIVRQLLDGEAMLDGVPFDIAKAFPVTRKA